MSAFTPIATLRTIDEATAQAPGLSVAERVTISFGDSGKAESIGSFKSSSTSVMAVSAPSSPMY